MCNFLSALALPDGSVLCCPEYTDSHEHLVTHFGLDDGREPEQQRFVRIEFSPADDADWGAPEKWNLKLDESNAPQWWTDELQQRVRSDLESRVRRMIVRDKCKLLLGGVHILLGKASVDRVVNAHIVVMRGSSQVGEMWDSSRVRVMLESSRVRVMLESSQVGEMLGSSRVGVMWGSSRVGVMWESSQVGEMWGSSRVGAMWDSSRVGVMWDSSQAPRRPAAEAAKEQP